MKQLFVASTLYQVLCLATAIDERKVPDAQGVNHGRERILVLAATAQLPELADPLASVAGFAALATRFDRVVDLAELMWPRRPGQFAPSDDDLLVWEKLLRSHWELDDEPVQLILESIQVNPAIALSRIFDSAPIIVHSDGLMSYGPTRNPLPRHMTQRLDALLYVDLIPGLEPALLREHAPARIKITLQKVRALIDELAAEKVTNLPMRTQPADGRTALVLGQYLADLGILTPQEEHEEQCRMLTEAAARGAKVCVFKPHPSAGPGSIGELEEAATALGMELVTAGTRELAEVLIAQLQPDVVIGGFSTALATARYLFGIEAVAVGTDLMLERLTPYQNSNRIPVIITDALLVRGLDAPDDAPPTSESAPLQQLIDAVAFCMQPTTLAELRPQAERFLAGAVHAGELRYFKRRRLTVLGLPGSLPMRRPILALRRIPRRMLRLSRNDSRGERMTMLALARRRKR